MKKIILLVVSIVVILSISVFAFMGCQGTTSLTEIFSEYSVWDNVKMPEEFTYSMYKDGQEGAIGTLTMKVERASSNYYLGADGEATADTAIYPYSLSTQKSSYVAKTTLVLNDGSYKQESIALFNDNYQLYGSFQKITQGESIKSFVSTNVDGKRYYYKTNADGFSEEYAIKNGKYKSAPYFDNTMIYYVARSMPNDSTYANFSFNIFNHEKNDKEKVYLVNSCDTKTAIILNGNTYECRTIGMRTTDALLGTTNNIACFVCDSGINGYKQVITKIYEGEYYYLLNV